MKKAIYLLFTFMFLCTACSGKNVLELADLPEDYSLSEAKNDDCVVFENSDITYGQEIWESFTGKTNKGKNAFVRLAFYYTLDDSEHYDPEYYEEIKDDYPKLFIQDLRFDGDMYHIEWYEDGSLISMDYKYMMKYEGITDNPFATYTEYIYFVLVNDNSVTWDDIEKGMLSSYSGDHIDHYMVYLDKNYK